MSGLGGKVAATPSLPAPVLNQGMTGEKIQQVMGKPLEVRRTTVAGHDGEVWVYRRPIDTRVSEVAARIVEEPWIDPITGELKYLPEPAYNQQRVELIEETRVFLSEGRLVEVKRSVYRERRFVNRSATGNPRRFLRPDFQS